MPGIARRSQFSLQPLKRFFWIVTALMLLWTVALPALGQLPNLITPPNEQAPPAGVERRGSIEAVGVRLDGRELFKVASPTVYDRSKTGNQIPVENRARQIEANLEQVINQTLAQDPTATSPNLNSLRVEVEMINNQPVLLAKDAESAQPKVLLTIIDSDTQYHSTSGEDLAQQWQKILQDALQGAVQIRRPGAVGQQIAIAIGLLIGTILLTIGLIALWRWLGQRQQLLEQRSEQQAMSKSLTTPDSRPSEREDRSFFDGFRQQLTLKRRIRILKFLRWLFFWGIIFLWIVSLSTILYKFPQTRPIAIRLLPTPFLLLIAWFLTGLANRLANLGIDRFAKAWEDEEVFSMERLERRSLRISTVTNTVKGLATVLIYGVGMIWVLQSLNIANGSGLAFGAFLALAASFAAQNLVKDLANGFLILLEDQYAIGDFIKVNQVSGLVENLNLRLTQIRNDAGHLITIPNSQISQVENMTRTWSRVDLQVEVTHLTDVDKALSIMHDTAQELAQDPEWQATILNSEELLGVDKISNSGIVLRIWMRTIPLKQWALARELRRRLIVAFDRHDIQMGIQPAAAENLGDRAKN